MSRSLSCPGSLRGLLVAMALLVYCNAVSSSEPKKDRPFEIETDSDGIRTFTLPGKKPAGAAGLLPAAPKALPKVMSASDLAQVPEISLEDPLPKSWSKQEAIEQLEFRFAKVNYFGLQKTDGFVQALLANRPDLAGLPFKMGADCRLSGEKAAEFASAIGKARGERERLVEADDALHRPMVAALMQIHGPNESQSDLARTLGTIPNVEATRALARLALFSADAKSREIAARGLKVRRDQDYTAILLNGLRYPWPTVARRASEALVRLERNDLLPQLVAALESPDPRLPVHGSSGWEAREMVRINHHRNCLLCHAAANVKTVVKVPNDDGKTLERQIKVLERTGGISKKMREETANLLAPVPLPNRSFDQGKDGYRGDHEMERILVRVDVTYLRQDFSAMLMVEDAAPWPDFQRFDFLARTRPLTTVEADALRQRLQPRDGGATSPYQQAALYGLRELTGLEATTPAEWRRLLKSTRPTASAE